MKRESTTSPEAESAGGEEFAWSWQARAVASALIAFHVLAVFLSPCAGPPPASDLERGAVSLFDPYLQAAYLNHGYRFFAPNPGPGQLVRVEYEMADGATRSERYPDPKLLWPRLHYHRYLILAAYLSDVSNAAGSDLEERTRSDAELKSRVERLRLEGHPAEADWIAADGDREAAGRKHAEARLQAILDAWGKELLAKSGARKVKFYAVEHEIPPPWEIRAGMELTDARLYRERLLGERGAP